MARQEAIRRMIFAGQTLVLAGIISGIFCFWITKNVLAIGVVAFGEVLWAAGWIMRGFTHPDDLTKCIGLAANVRPVNIELVTAPYRAQPPALTG